MNPELGTAGDLDRAGDLFDPAQGLTLALTPAGEDALEATRTAMVEALEEASQRLAWTAGKLKDGAWSIGHANRHGRTVVRDLVAALTLAEDAG